MTGPFVELVHEREDSFLRDAESSHQAALVSRRTSRSNAACWARNGYAGTLNWFRRGQLGPGYIAPRVGCRARGR